MTPPAKSNYVVVTITLLRKERAIRKHGRMSVPFVQRRRLFQTHDS